MREVLSYFDDRKAEFARHIAVARLLEMRVDEIVDEPDSQVEVRHINTLKSGLLIHLYNIVEAVVTRTMVVVGKTVVAEAPKLWKDEVLKEWVRAVVWSGDERIGEGALARLTRVTGVLVSGQAPEAFKIKGEPGSWNDKSIKEVTKRLGCRLILSPEVGRAAYEKVYLDETTALTYLARRRNAIAHGETTFEEGASGLTLDELSKLADRILPFLQAVLESYKAYLDNKQYLAAVETAA